MKQSITFVHPTRFKRTEVQVGPDHWMIAIGVVAALARLGEVMSGTDLNWPVYAVAAVLAHARHWRHVRSLPVVGSLALALMSFGMSALISGAVINRWIAQSFRDAGWKIRNTDGELGEYSSRFLAVDRLGFHESDLMGGAMVAARVEDVHASAARPGGPVWLDTVPQARHDLKAMPSIHEIRRRTETPPVSRTREADAVMG